jgi:elongation factor 1-alpha
MNLPRINLVVVGHKDHGKSTLIGRLLYDSKAIMQQKLDEIRAELKQSGKKFEFAYILDSLEEERKGGLTIDIMHTPFKSKKYLYTIIDCPGHKEFIQKMLTGASEADAAVLVVSAKEGIEDQTRQHAFLIKTLGIKQLIIAVNKMDTIHYQENKYKQTCQKLQPILTSLGYHNIDMIPISAMKGDNVFQKTEKMPWYKKSTLIETLDQKVTPITQPLGKPLRGVVQDIYPYEDDRKIVACKIETGILTPGKQVVFNPSRKKATIKKILAFGTETTKAEPGDSIGLLLDPSINIERGEILSSPQNMPPTPKNFTAEVILFQDIQMKTGDTLTIHYGTAEKKCKVTKILTEIDPINLNVRAENPTKLDPETVGTLELTPLEPISIEKYSRFPELGRFVIQGKKGTAAAGIILDINTHNQT